MHTTNMFTASACALLAAHAHAGFQTPQYVTDGQWASWSEDGSRIAFRRDTPSSNYNRANAFTANADGSNATQLSFFQGNEAFGQYGQANGVRFRPGTNNVYWRDDRDGPWRVAYADSDGATGRTLTSISGHNTPVTFSADGNGFAYSYFLGSGGSHRVHVGSGAPRSVGSSFNLSNMRGNLEWGRGSRDDMFAVTRRTGSTDTLWILNTDGSGITQLTDDSFGRVYDPAWSHDGESIYFIREDANEQRDVWSIQIDTGTLTQWTNDALDQRWPAPSPDGSTLLYSVSFPDDTSVPNVLPSHIYALTIPGPGAGAFLVLAGLASARRSR